ncbi:MAG: beta-lactamase family protein [Deltaproteobacteria bacterium]|nr:beta-lactamase family protein [Deltaproteobacteria bacterium]
MGWKESPPSDAASRAASFRTTHLLTASLALASCGAPALGPDATVDDAATPGDATAQDAASREDGPAGALLDRADAIMGPAFAATPADLSQCVGGIAVIVTPSEELVHGWGATSLGGTTPPDARTLFQVGSITKVFTGLGMARLVEDGAFGPGTPADALLAEDLRGTAASWPTMGALITHHGGFPVFPDNLVDRDGDGRRDPDIDPRSPAAGYDRDDLRAALEGWSAAPDAPYVYSNLGLGLAGLAMQDHLGLASYDATLRRLVTEDLGMFETWGEVSAIAPAARARLAAGYIVEGSGRAAGIPGEMGVLASAGEIVTTGEDMRRFLRAVTGLAPGALDGAIARATAPLAEGPDGRAMGYAIEVEESAGLVLYRKGGNTSSYAAYVLWSTGPPVGVAVLTNCGGFMAVVGLAESLHEASRAGTPG